MDKFGSNNALMEKDKYDVVWCHNCQHFERCPVVEQPAYNAKIYTPHGLTVTMLLRLQPQPAEGVDRTPGLDLQVLKRRRICNRCGEWFETSELNDQQLSYLITYEIE